MTKILSTLVFLFIYASTLNAYSADLPEKALRTTAPYDGFSKCVAEQAISQVISKFPNFGAFKAQTVVSGSVDGVGPFITNAKLDFMAGTPTARFMFSVNLRSTDFEKGWQLIQGSNGEIFPYSSSVDSIGVVFQTNQGIGSVDLSSCQ